MKSVDYIREIKEYYQNELYGAVREEQKTDQQYRDDTFPVPEIREPHIVWRSGMGSRMVDAPAEQIITSNPQAFFVGDKESSIRLSELVNGIWIDMLKNQNPNPFKEFVKNCLGRGESFIKVCHNDNWVTKPVGKDGEGFPIFNRNGLPVLFQIPDPMIVYASPEEDENGVPERVVIIYERQPRDVIQRYKGWPNTKNSGIGDNKNIKVSWFEYWDKDTVHCEADGDVVYRKPNIYGFVPFVRRYSGFGRRSPDGSLTSLIVSEIRLSRDLIKQECITRSNIASIEHIFAHRPRTLISPTKISQEDIDEMSFGDYDMNALTGVDAATRLEKDDAPAVPPEMYMNHANIKAEIAQRNPFILAGFPMGSSGRQQDRSSIAAMRRFDSVVDNTETAFATAINMSLRICNTVPSLMPKELNKGDLDTKYKCSISLKAKDPIEEDRLGTLGSRYLLNNEIDPETNLIEFKGYTQDKARKILIKQLMWRVLLNSPDIAEIIGLRAAEKSGMAEDLQMIKARRMQIEKGTTLGQEMPKTTRERVGGEVQTEMGREMEPEGVRGARTPPENYTRGR